MPSYYAYLFLEFAVIIYALDFGWEHWNLKRLLQAPFLRAAAGLALIWFTLDEIAISMGFWAFPQGGTLPARIVHLPLEEYLIFFLHTLVCCILIGRYARQGP